jgi:hypothetical protein
MLIALEMQGDWFASHLDASSLSVKNAIFAERSPRPVLILVRFETDRPSGCRGWLANFVNSLDERLKLTFMRRQRIVMFAKQINAGKELSFKIR